MQEAFPVVVQQIFPVVRAIVKCCRMISRIQNLDQMVQKIVRITDAVIICVDQLLPVFHLHFCRFVRGKMGELPRITFKIVEFLTIGVQHKK